MIISKVTKWNVKVNHPKERCLANTGTRGQCPNTKQFETNYCAAHGANKGIESRNNKEVRNYRLQRWQKRVTEFADNDQIKSLREEVGILRMILEEMLNKCETTTDLLLYSSRMADTVMKIEKLVTSCDKLENKMGLLLSKGAVLQLAGVYVEIIHEFIPDPDIVEAISSKMAEAALQLENPLSE